MPFKELTIVAKVRVRKTSDNAEQYRIIRKAIHESLDVRGGEQLVDFGATYAGEPGVAYPMTDVDTVLATVRHQIKYGAEADKYPRTEKRTGELED
jgi:hypothetical protein|tara:strand:- start:258 stop:545 length:288 start_codon:yes stop_codon:yes gene_type:complete